MPLDERPHPPKTDDAPTEPHQTAESLENETLPLAKFQKGQALQSGQTIGRYTIVKLLGAGGMGQVYLAHDPSLDRKVALKLMLPQNAAKPQACERFLREARAAAKLQNDHIVRIHEVSASGVPFIAMEHLKGVPLDEYLKKKGSPSVAQIIRIGREVALGLAAAHDVGMTHRDIKPANLWLEAPLGRVKILDFGLARQNSEEGTLTQEGVIVGTPAYMAPEQANSEAVDDRTDLYSLGAVLYELVTGKLPHPGPNAMAIIAMLITKEPIPVLQLKPETPKALADLIHELLAKNPAARPPNARDVATRLAGIAKTVALGGLTVIPVDAPPSVFAEIENASTEPMVPTPASKDSKIFLVLGGLAGAALVAILAYFFLLPKPPAPESASSPPRSDRRKGDSTPSPRPTLEGYSPEDPAWLAQFQKQTPKEQVRRLREEYERLHPGTTFQIEQELTDGKITKLQIMASNNPHTLAPIAAFPGLQKLIVGGTGDSPQSIESLEPIRHLTLQWLLLYSGNVRDLTPLTGMPLTYLQLSGKSEVESFAPLTGMKLTELIIKKSQANLRELRSLPELRRLMISGGPIDAADLADLPVRNLQLHNCRELKHAASLKTVPLTEFYSEALPVADVLPMLPHPSLRFVNGIPAEHYAAYQKLQPEPISAWRLLGPLANTTGTPFELDELRKSVAPLFLDQEFPTLQGNARWTARQANGMGDDIKLDFQQLIPKLVPGEVYAYAPVTVNGEAAILRVGSNQNFTAWWNGERIVGPVKLNAYDCRDQLVRVKCLKGINHLLVKCASERVTSWHLRAGIATGTEGSLPDLTTTKPITGSPLDPAWAARVKALPPEAQIEELRQELVRRNPFFDGKFKHEIRENRVYGLNFGTLDLEDIRPLVVCQKLQFLLINPPRDNLAQLGRLEDVSPIAELKQLETLTVSCQKATDFSMLDVSKYRLLTLIRSQVGDSSFLQQLPLEMDLLHISSSSIIDLPPMKGRKFKKMLLHESRISDLEPLRGTKIELLFIGGG
ncbi:MAG: protein kinase domain-containing protein, partial [Gemmataceae bacterium]